MSKRPALTDPELRERATLVLARYRQDDPATGCWLWTGCKMSTGHGQVRIRNVGYLTHRLSAMLHLGLDITNRFAGSRKDRSQVNHKPECPNANCWNPDHLYVGTQQENIHDIKDFGQWLLLPSIGVCEKGHPYQPEQYRKNYGCLICRREGKRAYLLRRRDHINALRRQNREHLNKYQRAYRARTASLEEQNAGPRCD